MENIKAKTFSIFLLILLLISSILGAIIFVSENVSANGESWLTGWQYRKSHVVSASSGAGTNYQMKITVYYGSGSDSVGVVYTSSHCKTDFGDIRFTDNDGNTELHYWMQSKTDSNNAVFWVEVADDLSSSAQTIYVYYGHGDESTTSSGNNTFVFFDHFFGTTYDTAKWDIQSACVAPSVASSIATFTHSGTNVWIKSDNTYSYNTALYFYSIMPCGGSNLRASHGYYDYASDGSAEWDTNIIYTGSLQTLRQYPYGSRAGTAFGTSYATEYHIYSIERRSSTAIEFFIDGSSKEYSTTYIIPSTANIVLSQLTTGTGYVDWVFLKKFVYAEPVHSTWGTEETSASPTWAPTFTTSSVTNILVNEVFSYHPHLNETGNITVLVKPAWLSWSGGTLSGSTSVTGDYTINIEGESWNGTLLTYQNFTLTVSPLEVNLISEPDNPVFPTRCGESSIIMDDVNDRMDCWFASGDTVGGFGYDHLWYSYTTSKDDLGTFNTPQKVIDGGIRFPHVVKDGSTYYLFTSKPTGGTYGIYLYSSTDKTTWTPMNGGDAVMSLNPDVNSQWHTMWNPGVVVIDGIFHMFVECANLSDSQNQVGVRIGYSYSTIEAMEWDENRTEISLIPMGGSPCPIYVPDRDAIMLYYAELNSGVWNLKISTAFLDTDIFQPSSWVQSTTYDTIANGADPFLVEAGTDAEYNIVIQWFHGQPIYSDIYQEYSNLTLNSFFDCVRGIFWGNEWTPTFTSTPPVIGVIGVGYEYKPLLNETVSLVNVSLPNWIEAFTDTVRGYPTTTGTYTFSLKATSISGLLSAWQNWTVTVYPPSTISYGSHSAPPIDGYADIGRISLTFDDGLAYQYVYGYPILSSHDIPATMYVPTNAIGTTGSKVTISQLQTLQSHGWEIGSHGMSHSSMLTTGTSDVPYMTWDETVIEMRESKAFLESCGLVVETMAFPYGHENGTLQILADYYYTISRGVTNSYAGYSEIPIGQKIVYTIGLPSDWTTLKGYIDTAIANDEWISIYAHNVLSNGYFEDTSIDLNRLADYIQNAVGNGSLEAVTFIEGYYATRPHETVTSTSYNYNSQSTISFDIDQYGITDPYLRILSLTLTNSMLNSGLENWSGGNIYNWSGGSGLLSASKITDSETGNYGANLTVNLTKGGTVRGIYQERLLSELGLESGSTVSFTAFVKVPQLPTNITNIMIRFDSYNGATYINRTTSSNYVIGTTYQPISVSGMIREGADRVQFWITAHQDSLSTGKSWFFVDSCILLRAFGTASLTYFNGTEHTVDVNLTVNGVSKEFEGDLWEEVGELFDFSIDTPTRFVNITMESIGGCGIVELRMSGNLSFYVQYGSTTYDANADNFPLNTTYKDWTSVTVLGSTPSISPKLFVKYLLYANVTIGNMSIRPDDHTQIYITVYNFAQHEHNANVISWTATYGLTTTYIISGFDGVRYYTVWRDGRQISHIDVGGTQAIFSGWGTTGTYAIKATNIMTGSTGVIGEIIPFIGMMLIALMASMIYRRGFSLSTFLIILGMGISILVWKGGMPEFGIALTVLIYVAVIYMKYKGSASGDAVE